MKVKEYLHQAYRLDKRIQSDIEETLGKEGKSLNDSIDEQALQDLKVSCNRWLIEAKTYHENLKMWLVISNEVMDLTFIE